MIIKKIRYNAKFLKKNQIVLDIETTGLSSLYDKLVLLGLITYEKDSAYIIQYFAERDLEEVRLLEIFLKKVEGKKIISYNGDTFDLPFLLTRLSHHKLPANLIFDSLDIYKILRSKRNLIDFESMRLMDIEKLIDINRNDPSRYKSISKLTEEIEFRDKPEPILIHNQNDLIATENLINIEEIIKDKLSVKFEGYKFSLISAQINNDVAKVVVESSKKLLDSYFSTANYQFQSKDNKIIIYFTVIYGRISPKIGGYVTRNIYGIESKSPYKINPQMLIIKEGRMYNYQNILNFGLEIIKENLKL